MQCVNHLKRRRKFLLLTEYDTTLRLDDATQCLKLFFLKIEKVGEPESGKKLMLFFFLPVVAVLSGVNLSPSSTGAFLFVAKR